MTLRIEVAGQHGSASFAREGCEENADRALTNHQDCLVPLEIEPLNRLVACVDRLEKCSLFKRNSVGNLYEPAPQHDGRHDADVLGETATGRSEARSAPDVLIGLALREGLFAAVEALAARDVVVSHHAVAYRESVDAFACLHDSARHLMSEDARCIMRSGVNLLQICAADSAGVDLDQHLAGADLRHRDGFDADVIHAAIHGGSHHCGYCFCLCY